MTAEDIAAGAGAAKTPPTEAPPTTGICPGCGKDRALGGDHAKLACGHYRCIVGPNHRLTICSTCRKYTCNSVDHTRCPGCGVGACRHDDLKCDWSRNPVPTPYKKKDENGNWVYFHVDPSGQYYIGTPGGTPVPWQPAQTYIALRPSPMPTPVGTPMPYGP